MIRKQIERKRVSAAFFLDFIFTTYQREANSIIFRLFLSIELGLRINKHKKPSGSYIR